MASGVTPEYVLGHASNELQRLAYQAQYWDEATLQLLQNAGIEPGMHLLDIGSGAGDVSLLAATLVGPTGSVLGVDRSADAARLLTETTRSLLPMMERFGVATAAEVDVDTLSSRMQAAVAAQDATILPPAVVGAWARCAVERGD